MFITQLDLSEWVLVVLLEAVKVAGGAASGSTKSPAGCGLQMQYPSGTSREVASSRNLVQW